MLVLELMNTLIAMLNNVQFAKLSHKNTFIIIEFLGINAYNTSRTTENANAS